MFPQLSCCYHMCHLHSCCLRSVNAVYTAQLWLLATECIINMLLQQVVNSSKVQTRRGRLITLNTMDSTSNNLLPQERLLARPEHLLLLKPSQQHHSPQLLPHHKPLQAVLLSQVCTAKQSGQWQPILVCWVDLVRCTGMNVFVLLNCESCAVVEINPATGEADYTDAWAAYYRQMGWHDQADAILKSQGGGGATSQPQ